MNRGIGMPASYTKPKLSHASAVDGRYETWLWQMDSLLSSTRSTTSISELYINEQGIIRSYIDQLAKASIGLEKLSRHLGGLSQQNSATGGREPAKARICRIPPQKTQLPGKWTIWRCYRNCLDTEGGTSSRLCLPQGWYNRDFMLQSKWHGSPFW